MGSSRGAPPDGGMSQCKRIDERYHFCAEAIAGTYRLEPGVGSTPLHLACYANRGCRTMDVAAIELFYREESGRILATLIKLLGDFDLAEDAMQDAFAVAIEQWPAQGLPGNPRAWIVGTARHKALDRVRRRELLESKRSALRHDEELLGRLQSQENLEAEASDTVVNDERLRLIFTCCHPALA